MVLTDKDDIVSHVSELKLSDLLETIKESEQSFRKSTKSSTPSQKDREREYTI